MNPEAASAALEGSLSVVNLPGDWEQVAAPAATLLEAVGPSLVWWLLGALLLGLALWLVERRPELTVALAVTASFALGIAANGLVDDAYIQFRHAANLAEGHGPVFNPGERIEGASGGLWMVILGLLGAISGWDVAMLGRLASLLLVPLGTLAAARAGRVLGGGTCGAATALLWAALPTSALYAATGLETSAFALALWLTVLGVASARRALAACAGVLVATLRPEGPILAVVLVPLWRRLGRPLRAAIVGVLAGAAVIAGLRLAYYGLPVPRPALVKGVTAAAGFGHGARYLGAALYEWWPLLVALPLLVRQRGPARLTLLPVGVWSVMVVARGGDWMPGSRYLLPLLVLVTVGAARWIADGGRRRRSVLGVALAWGLLQLAPAEAPSRSPVGRLWRAMAAHRVQSRWWESLGAWLGNTVPVGSRLAIGPAGAVPYTSRLATFDLYGLCTPVQARRDGAPGHRMWGLQEAIDAGVDLIYPGQGLPQHEDWAAVLALAGKHVVSAPDIAETYAPVGIRHPPEYQSDVLTDVLWVRRALLPLETRSLSAPQAEK